MVEMMMIALLPNILEPIIPPAQQLRILIVVVVVVLHRHRRHHHLVLVVHLRHPRRLPRFQHPHFLQEVALMSTKPAVRCYYQDRMVVVLTILKIIQILRVLPIRKNQHWEY